MRFLVRTRACKRCGGDLSLERDKYGTYMECIQCGASWSERDLANNNNQKTSEPQVTIADKPFKNKQNFER